jgi:hypothetical protein
VGCVGGAVTCVIISKFCLYFKFDYDDFLSCTFNLRAKTGYPKVSLGWLSRILCIS